jgi:hypothetical protein
VTSKPRQKQFTQNPWLSEANVPSLLHQLEQNARTDVPRRVVSKGSRRAHKRIEYRQANVALIVEHPGGTSANFLVCTRNISAGGISILHGGFIHPGSRCKIGLPQRDGNQCALIGTVVSCRAVDGFIHEVGLKFQHLIDPADFVAPQSKDGSLVVSDDELAEARLHGIAARALKALTDLQRVIDPPDLASARSICSRLKTDATEMGANSLALCAGVTVNALDETASIAKAVTHLHNLMSVCQRLSQGPSAKAG